MTGFGFLLATWDTSLVDEGQRPADRRVRVVNFDKPDQGSHYQEQEEEVDGRHGGHIPTNYSARVDECSIARGMGRTDNRGMESDKGAPMVSATTVKRLAGIPAEAEHYMTTVAEDGNGLFFFDTDTTRFRVEVRSGERFPFRTFRIDR